MPPLSGLRLSVLPRSAAPLSGRAGPAVRAVPVLAAALMLRPGWARGAVLRRLARCGSLRPLLLPLLRVQVGVGALPAAHVRARHETLVAVQLRHPPARLARHVGEDSQALAGGKGQFDGVLRLEAVQRLRVEVRMLATRIVRLVPARGGAARGAGRRCARACGRARPAGGSRAAAGARARAGGRARPAGRAAGVARAATQ